jgi:hypothetical protein
VSSSSYACLCWLIPNLSFLFVLLIALDGNFKLKRKNRNIKDPELSNGWSYFVEEKAYQTFLGNAPEEIEVSFVHKFDCVKHS